MIYVQHVFANQFFNEKCLDFSNSPPNDQNEYFLENANMIWFHKEVISSWCLTTGFKLAKLVSHVGMFRMEDFLLPSQNASPFRRGPFRREPVDGAVFLDFDTYSHVLVYGKALGLISSYQTRS